MTDNFIIRGNYPFQFIIFIIIIIITPLWEFLVRFSSLS